MGFATDFNVVLQLFLWFFVFHIINAWLLNHKRSPSYLKNIASSNHCPCFWILFIFEDADKRSSIQVLQMLRKRIGWPYFLLIKIKFFLFALIYTITIKILNDSNRAHHLLCFLEFLWWNTHIASFWIPYNKAGSFTVYCSGAWSILIVFIQNIWVK